MANPGVDLSTRERRSRKPANLTVPDLFARQTGQKTLGQLGRHYSAHS